MRGEKAGSGKELSRTVKGVLWGGLAGTALTFLLIALSAWAVVKMQRVPYGAIPPMVIAAESIGAFFGGYLCGRLRRRYGMALGAACGLVIFCVMLLTGTASGGTMNGVTFLRLGLMLLGGALGGVLGVNQRKRRK